MKQAYFPRIVTTVITALSILLTGCSPTVSTVPTTDINQVSTAAVVTYQAQQTLTQAANPTEVPQATSTPADSPANVELPSPTLGPVAPTITPQIYIAPEDKASLITQKPSDGSEVRQGRKFDVIWTVKNDGKTTWSKTYTVRYYAGAALGEGYVFNFGKDVPPGSKADIVADMIAPNYEGTFKSIWVLTNDKGENFYQVFVTVKVVNRPLSTVTPTPNLTPAVTSAG
jgi:hypothetical protein